MAEPVRFYLDQNMHGGTAPGLRTLGIDAVSAQEAGRCGLSDADQLAFAVAEGRVLVTFDQDFVVILAVDPSHAGIAWCHPSKYAVGTLIQALTILHGVYTADDMRNHLQYL